MWKNGWITARTSQYTIGLTPRPRARSRYVACSMPLVRRVLGVVTAVTSAWRRAYHAQMAATSAQTARGAVAGAVAAGIWAAQQPLDKAIFGVDYDDVELLGRAVPRGPAWAPIGTAMHVANGALLGALYANVAPRMPLPSWARGPFAALL